MGTVGQRYHPDEKANLSDDNGGSSDVAGSGKHRFHSRNVGDNLGFVVLHFAFVANKVGCRCSGAFNEHELKNCSHQHIQDSNCWQVVVKEKRTAHHIKW